MKKEKITFERLFLNNRWKQKEYSRNCNWTIIGIHKHWAGPSSFCYKLCFFGIDIHIWFNREFID